MFYYYFHLKKHILKKKNINCTFVGHPLLEVDKKAKIDVDQIIKNKKIISIFPGSRSSEIDTLTPILFKFIKMMKDKYIDIHFVFHTTNEHRQKLQYQVTKEDLKKCEVISDEKIKSHVLEKSIFAVSKSGTISLEICNAKVPSIIIYKMNFINFLIVKMLVKVKFANIINIAAEREIIPELLQEKCNPKDIFDKVDEFMINPELSKKQINEYQEIINKFKTDQSSVELASSVLISNL